MMTTPPSHPRPRQSGNGFIVVAVLWIMSALATLAVIYSVYVARVAGALTVADDRLQVEALVSAALELAAYQLDGAQVRVAPTHGQFTFHTGRANVSVQYISEAARIDLNQAPKELLVGLFSVLAANPDRATNYAENVIAWRTPPRARSEDGETARYLADGLAYGPRRGPFAHVDELRLVRGLPSEVVERALPLVTVFSGVPGVNVREAAPEVIAAIPGMTQDRLNALLQRRQAESASPRSATIGLDPMSAGTSRAVRINILVALDNGRRVISEAVIATVDERDVPYRVLSWHDGFDDPSDWDGATRTFR